MKDNQMLHSDQDLSHYLDRSLSDFLCTKLLSGSQNVHPFSPRTVFLQTQSHMSKRPTSFLQLLSQITQPNREDVLPTTASGQQRHFIHYEPVLEAFSVSPGLSDRFLSLPEKEIWSPYFNALTKTLLIYPVKQ